MSILDCIQPHLRPGGTLSIRFSKEGDAVRVTLIQTSGAFRPDSEDAGVAEYQAALARPLTFLAAPDGEFEKLLRRALDTFVQSKAQALDALDAYEAQMEADQEAAKKAADEARSKKTTKKDASSKKPDTKKPNTNKPAAPEPPPPPKEATLDMFGPANAQALLSAAPNMPDAAPDTGTRDTSSSVDADSSSEA